MNRINSLNRKEEAVSPVIATILMVAITVVLAATLYMMIGDMSVEGTNLLAGNLDIDRTGTYDEGKFVVLNLGLNTPPSADMDDISVVVFDNDGSLYEEVNGPKFWANVTEAEENIFFTYRGAGADTDEIVGGARLRINFEGEDFNYKGYEVEISISGYSGRLRKTL